MKKENLYDIYETQHKRYAAEIRSRAALMFDKGYSLSTIHKSLCGSYRAVSGFDKEYIRQLVGEGILEYIEKENRGVV